MTAAPESCQKREREGGRERERERERDVACWCVIVIGYDWFVWFFFYIILKQNKGVTIKAAAESCLATCRHVVGIDLLAHFLLFIGKKQRCHDEGGSRVMSYSLPTRRWDWFACIFFLILIWKKKDATTKVFLSLVLCRANTSFRLICVHFFLMFIWKKKRCHDEGGSWVMCGGLPTCYRWGYQ